MQSWSLMRNGVAVFNGLLVGTVLAAVFPQFYETSRPLALWIFMALGAFARSADWLFFGQVPYIKENLTSPPSS